MIFKDFDIEKLLELMEKYDTAEISLRDGKTAIEVKRLAKSEASMEKHFQMRNFQNHDAPMPTNLTQKTPPFIGDKPVNSSHKNQPGSTVDEANLKEIKAPLVGTFYRAPSPDAHPYVEVGDAVNAGDTLCIVEAMKNMNEIESDITGTIKEICIQNAELVEYGQVMFKIEIPDSRK